MKRTLILTTILTLPMLGLAEDKPLKERAADAVETVKRDAKEAADATAKTARNFWKSTKAYVTQDPAEFREGANRKLDEFAKEIDQLKSESKGELKSRAYFGTRIKALNEHLAFARAELGKLPSDKGEFPAARKAMNHTLDGLEGAIDEAQREVRDRK